MDQELFEAKGVGSMSKEIGRPLKVSWTTVEIFLLPLLMPLEISWSTRNISSLRTMSARRPDVNRYLDWSVKMYRPSGYSAPLGNTMNGRTRSVSGSTTAPVSYTHLRAHETPEHLVCRLLLEKKK